MLERISAPKFDNESALKISSSLLSVFQKRKTTRDFSPQEIDIEIIKNAIAVAGTAPSGANKQPWGFSIIGDQKTKKIIREQAELEEKKFYEETAPKKWLDDLMPLHTDASKKFLTDASYLIPIFAKQYSLDERQEKSNNYYVKESVGIATGMLISALHLSGLSVLTYTPTNRNFLVELLGRPRNERNFMVLVVGVPDKSAQAPILTKKPLDQILNVFKGVINNRYES